MAFIRKYGRIMLGSAILLTVLFLAIFAPVLASADPYLCDPTIKWLDPGSPGHPLGTDNLGRDVWAWIVYGARLSLIIPIGVQIMTVVIGTLIGLLCGYYPKVDAVLMRVMEAFNAIPTLVITLLICEALGRGVFNLMLGMALGGFIGVARLVRGRVLSVRKEEYIECEKVMGASGLRTMFLHVLPACSNTLLVRFSTGHDRACIPQRRRAAGHPYLGSDGRHRARHGAAQAASGAVSHACHRHYDVRLCHARRRYA